MKWLFSLVKQHRFDLGHQDGGGGEPDAAVRLDQDLADADWKLEKTCVTVPFVLIATSIVLQRVQQLASKMTFTYKCTTDGKYFISTSLVVHYI